MPISSKTGNVKFGVTPADLLEVVDWTLEHTAGVIPYASSDSAGGMLRIAGIEDLTATVQCLQDATTQVTDGLPIGTSGTVELYESAALKWSGTMIVESVGPATPIGTGGLVTYTIRFGRNGTVTVPT